MGKKSVYVMEANGEYKIGVAKNPTERLLSLGIGNRNIQLIYQSEKLSNAYGIESRLHTMFSRCSIGREWFRPQDGRAIIETTKEVVAKYGETHKTEPRNSCEMFVKEDGKVYPLDEWIAKTQAETDKMRKENEELQKLLYSIQGQYVPNIFMDLLME